jgi:hypothetical protein
VKHPSTFLKQPPTKKKKKKKSWESITHVMNKNKQKKKTIHLPHTPTDIAVMLTTLPTEVSNVVTTMKNTGRSAVAWTVVPVPTV